MLFLSRLRVQQLQADSTESQHNLAIIVNPTHTAELIVFGSLNFPFREKEKISVDLLLFFGPFN